MNEEYENAAQKIREATGMVIGAGAGFGVDSGLPDFRGDTGFWKAYPPYKKQNLSFIDLANPKWFDSDPELAWGFYGHRTHLYRDTKPHNGFGILKKWSDNMENGAVVFTSNVDGHFQKAGFSEDRILECHGSIHHHQCSGFDAQCEDIWDFTKCVDVDAEFKAVGDLPRCKCGRLSRPNILMFNDYSFLAGRVNQQQDHYYKWVEARRSQKIVIIEVGAGQAIPTVRHHSEQLGDYLDATVIRINLREPEGEKVISLGGRALDILTELDSLI